MVTGIKEIGGQYSFKDSGAIWKLVGHTKDSKWYYASSGELKRLV